MKLVIMARAIIVLSIFFLSSCRYSRWAIEQLPQAGTINYEAKLVARYIRSLHLYDQFDTIGHFDVLWLSDDVRCQYACVHARKNELCAENAIEFERRQLEENNYFISFYLLVSESDSCKIDSASGNSSFSVSMKIDDETHHPVQMKHLDDLPSEYALFFGLRFNKFKRIYLVKFDAADCNSNRLISPFTKTLDLCFTKMTRFGSVRWYLTQEGEAISEPHKESNILAYDLKT
ncbi:MAG TPA: hypothetical protein VHO47_02535 [Candidatus Babeliales bacterium]|nr:hypothetical protein [Candidatus Babeliales bacterium]